MRKIFLIEDDGALRGELSRILVLQGYAVEPCRDFANAAKEALLSAADMLIVDLRLPETDGLSICREVRAESSVPILILTSSDSEFDEVTGMRFGADDYLTKPYSPAVLLAHIERLLERAYPDDSSVLEYRGVALDASRSVMSYGGASAELSRNEMRILSTLVRGRGKVVSRQELMFELWQSDEFVDDNTLTVNVNRLRKALSKIGAPGDYLKTHRGQGYSL